MRVYRLKHFHTIDEEPDVYLFATADRKIDPEAVAAEICGFKPQTPMKWSVGSETLERVELESINTVDVIADGILMPTGATVFAEER